MKLKLSTLIPLAMLGLALVACSKDDRNAPRTDGFEIHALADCSDEPLKEFCVDVLEGTSELYIRTDVTDFNVFWQDAAGTPWLEVSACEKTDVPSVWKVTLNYSGRSEGVLYTRRTGTLSVTKPKSISRRFCPCIRVRSKGPATTSLTSSMARGSLTMRLVRCLLKAGLTPLRRKGSLLKLPWPASEGTDT